MKRVLLTCFIVMLAIPVFAQRDPGLNREFPFYLLPGESLRVPAEFDTLWIFNQETYKNAVKKALQLEVADSLAKQFELKSAALEAVIVEKDTIISMSREGYIHYRDLWEATDRKLEEAEVKNAKRWQVVFWGFVTGAVTSGLLVGLL